MNSLRKVLGFLLAGLMLAAFASPGMAQTKIYSLKMSYLGSTTISGPAGTTTAPTYRALYTNETPNGNSTINSLILAGPGGLIITNAQLQPANVQINTSIAGIGSNTISISNLIGVKAGGNSTYVDVQVSGTPPPCSAWSPQAFAGNAFSQPFALQSQLSILSTGTGAGACQIDVVMAPASVNQNSTGVAMTATVKNVNASGGFSSLTLTPPTTIGLTVPSLPTVTLPSGTTASVAWCGAAGGPICVTNILPAIAPGAQMTVNLSVNVAATCFTTLNDKWGATAYAGATQNGTVFTTDPASVLATAIAAIPCTVSVSPSPPKNGIKGTALPPVTVTVSGGTGSGTASVTASGCTLISGGASQQTPATFSNLVISAASTSCTLMFTVPGFGTASYGPFTVFDTGPIACAPAGTYTFDFSPSGGNINTPGYFNGQRGAYNKDGTPCVEVGITAQNNIISNNSVTFNWDVQAQAGASFLYTLTWKPEYVDMASGGTGLPKQKTYVQWLVNGAPTPSTPVLGRACVAWNPTQKSTAPTIPLNYLPLPYGYLAADVGQSDGVIQVTPATGTVYPNTSAQGPLPTPPFAITIDKERMTVTAIDSTLTQWTVVRGTTLVDPSGTATGGGGTGQVAHLASGSCPAFAGKNCVMSNPLPEDDRGQQMRVCIAEEGWSIFPAGSPNCPVAPAIGSPTVPTSCTLVTTTLYDVGDTTIIRQ